jgi:hypothetical protein
MVVGWHVMAVLVEHGAFNSAAHNLRLEIQRCCHWVEQADSPFVAKSGPRSLWTCAALKSIFEKIVDRISPRRLAAVSHAFIFEKLL